MSERSEEPLVTIAECVSHAVNMPIKDLPPLSHSIDPEGLVAILEDDLSNDVMVTFPYAGQRVLVRSDNTVCVRPVQNGKIDRWETVSSDK